jgi:hypothetical protein
MRGPFLGTQRTILVTQFALVAGVKVVKGGDVLGGRVARDAVERRKGFPRSPHPQLCDPLLFVVESHLQLMFPKPIVTKQGDASSGWRCA